MSRSKFLNFVKTYPSFKKFYFFYNIYIRNFKFLKNGSQFQEDKFILENFPKDHKGIYLDIGCFHPTRHNNTFSMYKKGWKGINIDMNPLSIELFEFCRPRDINLNVAISNDNLEKKVYFLGDLNTQNTLDNNQLNFLKSHHNVRDHEIVEKKIKTQNINSILDKFKFYNIDFMNLDVEGHEIEVLKSIDFNKINIKFLCVEIINHNQESIEKGKKIHSYLTLNRYQLIKQLDFNYIYKKYEFTSS